MATSDLPRPTDGELAILRALWLLGPSTVRQVHDELSQHQSTGYTTVLKLLQIMTEKGLVERDEEEKAHIYRAKISEQRTQRQLVNDLLARAFDGSAAKLVMQALASRPASRKEVAEIRQLLDELQRSAR